MANFMWSMHEGNWDAAIRMVTPENRPHLLATLERDFEYEKGIRNVAKEFASRHDGSDRTATEINAYVHRICETLRHPGLRPGHFAAPEMAGFARASGHSAFLAWHTQWSGPRGEDIFTERGTNIPY